MSINTEQYDYKPLENKDITRETVREPGNKTSTSLTRPVNTPKSWKSWAVQGLISSILILIKLNHALSLFFSVKIIDFSFHWS